MSALKIGKEMEKEDLVFAYLSVVQNYIQTRAHRSWQRAH